MEQGDENNLKKVLKNAHLHPNISRKIANTVKLNPTIINEDFFVCKIALLLANKFQTCQVKFNMFVFFYIFTKNNTIFVVDKTKQFIFILKVLDHIKGFFHN